MNFAQQFKADEEALISPVLENDLIIQSLLHPTVNAAQWFQVFDNNKPLQDSTDLVSPVEAWKLLDFENLENGDEVEDPPTLVQYFGGSRDLKDRHLKTINDLWNQMKKNFKYLNASDMLLVVEALKIAYMGLWGKTTARSLEVSINRAKGTAEVLGNSFNSPVEVILAGILHEILAGVGVLQPELELVKSEILKRFGSDVYSLSETYNKLPKFMSRKVEYTPEQSENHIQMLIATLDDYRTLYIRLADRIHTMRILKELPLDDLDRKKISMEALYVYAPLAHRMGLSMQKGELEDLAFRFSTTPDFIQMIRFAQVKAGRAQQEVLEDVQRVLENDDYLKMQKVSYKLTHRIKGKYQLFLKMHRKNLHNIDEVRDALGMRVIFDVPRNPNESNEAHTERSEAVCYYLVDRLREMKRWTPGKFKDYIKAKKDSGYQSLHQDLRSSALGTSVEIQVRTMAMHVEAELGEAAHWYYKDLTYKKEVVNTRQYRLAWKSEAQSLAKSSAEFLRLAHEQLNAHRVFIFLEDRSTVIPMPKGACSLDAAFAVHSEVGLTTSVVKVNGKAVGLNRPLKNGDVVSVSRSEDRTVTARVSWLNIVKSHAATQSLKKHFKSQPGSLAALGALQLLMTMSLNKERIAKRFAGDKAPFPDAAKLAKYASDRSGLPNLAEVLKTISIAPPEQVAEILGRLLDIPAKELQVSTQTLRSVWARGQEKGGWADLPLREKVLLPILRNILPELGEHMAEQKWSELVGASALVSDVEVPELFAADEIASPVSTELVSAFGQDKSDLIFRLTFSSRQRMYGSSPRPRAHRFHMKSPYVLARYPYALESSVLTTSLRRQAIKSYAAKAIRREKLLSV